MKIPAGTIIHIGRQKISGEISDEKARALGIPVPEKKISMEYRRPYASKKVEPET